MPCSGCLALHGVESQFKKNCHVPVLKKLKIHGFEIT